jgi:thimet oligopeptidase
MWSVVIAKDLLSVFQDKGMLDSGTARKLRDTVLGQGGVKDAALLVKDFLGRDYEFGAYERWLNSN